MVTPTSPPSSKFNAFARHIYNPIGFTKTYNFILWFIFSGALFGFVLARFMYLNFSGHFCPEVARGSNNASPGECYWYLNFSRYKIGILLHLGAILPACILLLLQFIPAIRHKWILFHRINGYVVLLLYVLSLVGVYMITRHAFGGGLDVQSASGVLGIMTMGSFILAWINIKRLQIEQHRAWMLRGWFYASCIVTTRPILIISALIITSQKSYYTARPCAQIDFMLSHNSTKTLQYYPTCSSYFNGSDPHQEAAVHADFNGIQSEIGVSLGMSFGMAIWVALWLHAIGIEIYLHLTPKEAERLRKVSYQRQLEAGWQSPGRAGLTADRVGDAEMWVYREKKVSDATLVGAAERVSKEGVALERGI